MTPKILIVDDDQEFVKNSKKFPFSAEIHAFTDAGEALEKISFINPQIIITDVMMPGIHGLRFLSIAKDLIHVQPEALIVISANEKGKIEKDFGKIDGSSFFRKPLDEEFFMHVIQLIEKFSSDGSKESILQNSPIIALEQLNRLADVFKAQQDFLYSLAIAERDITSADYQNERALLDKNVEISLDVLVGYDQKRRENILNNLGEAYPTWKKQVLNNVSKFIIPRKVKCDPKFKIGSRVPKSEYLFKGVVESYEVDFDNASFPVLKINQEILKIDLEYLVEPYVGLAGSIVITARFLDYLDRCYDEAKFASR